MKFPGLIVGSGATCYLCTNTSKCTKMSQSVTADNHELRWFESAPKIKVGYSLSKLSCSPFSVHRATANPSNTSRHPNHSHPHTYTSTNSKMQSTLVTRRSVTVSSVRPQSRKAVVTRAALDPTIVISATTVSRQLRLPT